MTESTASAKNGEEAVSQEEGTTSASDDNSKHIEELETQLKEEKSRYLYLYAEFENYKKRAIKDRSDLLKFGWEQVARELLQVADNLERALQHMPASTDSALKHGLELVLNQFKGALQKQGVEHIESVKQNFDPNLHEAISHEPSEHPEGIVVKELTRGYTLHGRLLRPASVVVSNGSKVEK